MTRHSRRLVRVIRREFHRNVLILTSVTYGPDKIRVRVAEADYKKMEPIVPFMCKQFSEFLEKVAQKRGYKLSGGCVAVGIERDDDLEPGQITCESEFSKAVGNDPHGMERSANRFSAPTRLQRQDITGVELNPHDAPPTVIPIGREPFTIGRDGCDVVIGGNPRRVSRSHASIAREDGVIYLKDLGSTNGTFVNDRRIEDCILRDGDEIAIGDLTLRYSLEEGALLIEEGACKLNGHSN